MRRITREAGQEVHPHSLRDTTATLLTHRSVPMQVTQRIVGHSTIAMTAAVYTHVMDDAIRRILDGRQSQHIVDEVRLRDSLNKRRSATQ